MTASRVAWIGTKTGLSIWNGDNFFNLTQDNGLPNDNIAALLADDDAMWIGTNGGGLFRSSAISCIFSRENADLPSNTITALARDGDGALLVGTAEGLVRFVDGVATPVEDVPASRPSRRSPRQTSWSGSASKAAVSISSTAIAGRSWPATNRCPPCRSVPSWPMDTRRSGSAANGVGSSGCQSEGETL